jgi:hypothetical protein
MALTLPAAAGEMVPFKGTLEGSFTASLDPPPAINRQLNAAGNATMLGDFTYDFPHTVDRSVVPATGVGYSTFTAANGDQLFAFISGQATFVMPGLLHAVENGTILGGTHRFANAFGSFVIDRSIDTINLTTVGSFVGTLSSPGAKARLAHGVGVPEPGSFALLGLALPVLLRRRRTTQPFCRRN